MIEKRSLVSSVVLLLLIVGMFSSSYFLHGVFENSVTHAEFYADRNPIVAGGIFVGLAAMSVVFGPFTSVFLIPAAVAIWGAVATFFLLLLGWVIGGIIAYGLGRFLGYPLVSRIVSKEKTDEMAHVVSSRATFALALVFRLIMPAETGYIFGLIRYNFLRYCIVMFIAELPFAFFGVWVSDAFVDQHFILFFSALIGGFRCLLSWPGVCADGI